MHLREWRWLETGPSALTREAVTWLPQMTRCQGLSTAHLVGAVMLTLRQGTGSTEKLSNLPRTTQEETEQGGLVDRAMDKRENTLLLPGVQGRPRRDVGPENKRTKVGMEEEDRVQSLWPGEAAPYLLWNAEAGPRRWALHTCLHSPACPLLVSRISSSGHLTHPLTGLRSPPPCPSPGTVAPSSSGLAQAPTKPKVT